MLHDDFQRQIDELRRRVNDLEEREREQMRTVAKVEEQSKANGKMLAVIFVGILLNFALNAYAVYALVNR